MNEQIKELLKQAGVGDNWNKADWYSMNPEMIEKFAELIVQKCAGRVDWILAEGGGTQGDLIREHFGVAE